MSIADAAGRSGLPAKTIRYYEDIGLVSPGRAANGYRVFSDRDIHILTFIARARSLGFSIEDCRTLVALYQDPGRASEDVKRVATDHLARMEAKIVELESLRSVLADLVDRCHGDDLPDCPILGDLSGRQSMNAGRLTPADPKDA